MEKVNQVSIRLVKERPLLSEEQLTSPEKVAITVGDYIRDIDREVLCVINFNSKFLGQLTVTKNLNAISWILNDTSLQ